MNVLNAGIVHTAFSAGVRVQGAFKDGTEDGWAYLRPVKIAGFINKQVIS